MSTTPVRRAGTALAPVRASAMPAPRAAVTTPVATSRSEVIDSRRNMSGSLIPARSGSGCRIAGTHRRLPGRLSGFPASGDEPQPRPPRPLDVVEDGEERSDDPWVELATGPAAELREGVR